MATITGSDAFFTNINSGYTATKWEAHIEQAIDQINACLKENDELPPMTGTAGSKSIVVTSRQAGWIRAVAMAFYAQSQTSGSSGTNFSMPGYSEGKSNSTSSSGSPQELAQKAANALKTIQVLKG